jgi:hypothetical protein
MSMSSHPLDAKARAVSDADDPESFEVPTFQVGPDVSVSEGYHRRAARNRQQRRNIWHIILAVLAISLGAGSGAGGFAVWRGADPSIFWRAIGVTLFAGPFCACMVTWVFARVLFSSEEISCQSANRIVIILAIVGALFGAVGIGSLDEKFGQPPSLERSTWCAGGAFIGLTLVWVLRRLQSPDALIE